MLCLLIIVCFMNGAYSSDITARGDTSVVFGEEASLSCALSNPSGVKQVTWQRARSDDRAETLATFSEVYKHHVEDQYVGKVTLTTASYNSTSIVIKNVTFEDEACYICSFQAYPVGAKWKTLCLTVKGISEITANINPASSSDSEVSVTCSATGKPTPILQWKSTEKHQNLKLSGSNTSVNVNNDGSNTTTSILKLTSSQYHGKYVECVALSGNIEEKYQIYLKGENDEENITSRSYIITVIIVVFMLIIILVIICLYKLLKESLRGEVVIEC
ncbi:OX-2 membrane glycoprotein-like isoform X2 [Paramisgurnus dabryanus]|uniref:OX-2 membrane glycoprotein-like isoform X2 n=1 Tax=Paramisgurnus dabryanus TaxID=90735 RepID=UPI003CCF9308